MRFDFNSYWSKGYIGDLIEKTGKKANNTELNYTAYSITNSDGFVVQADNWEGGSYVQASKEGYKVIHNGEIAYNPARINVGSIGYFEQKNGIISSLYVCLKPKKELVPKYLFHYMKSNIFNKIVLKRQEGGVRDYFFYENLCGVKINYPSIMEQEKIVSFLELINARILTQKKIIEDKEILKKQICNKLMSTSKDYIKLKNISQIYQPETIGTNSFDNNAQYFVYGANGIIGKYDKYNHLNPQICITCRGATCGNVHLTQEKSWITGNAMIVNVDNNPKINKLFLYYYLSNYKFNSVISGSGQPQITRKPIENILVPSIDLEEQSEIAKIIKCFEDNINYEKKILSLYKLQKQYLINKLFI